MVLRAAQPTDLPSIDELTVSYAPIQASYVAMLGEERYDAVRHEPELTWEQRKIAQNRRLYDRNPDVAVVLLGHEPERHETEDRSGIVKHP